MPNRLADETSPYLRQHAGNPVDWYPWGAEALRRARDEDRPILLSIGYAACHWCHVMAHESFEDPATAALMNELFVNIKVDREERPDIDAIYMQAVQAMTGHGGWPLTAFLTPAGVPFYTGTYFPKEDRYGMPSFRRVLAAVGEAYRERRADVARTSESIREMFAASSAPTRSSGAVTTELLERASRAMIDGFDAEHGGFGGAPKFPQPLTLEFLLEQWARTGDTAARDVVASSFRHMARGGIYDQVGGGFARYAVDAGWQVPHFEKMLYDNALLARLGVHLAQATGDVEVRRVTEETLDWMAREMMSSDGAFHASFDADSEGHEGKFYLWDVSQLDALLGDDAPLVKAYWGVTDEGNFEGRNILHVSHEADVLATRHGVTRDHLDAVMARARTVLYAARGERVWPARDDKILASWNGLALRAFAEAARAFRRADYRAIAERTGDFLFRELVRDGRVHRSFGGGTPRISGFLEDYGAVGLGALALYELSFDTVWLDRARALADAAVEWFWDADTGAFYDTPRDHEALITRPREVTDNALPSGTSLVTELLVRLSELLHDIDMRRRATYVVETLAEPMARYPMAFGHLLGVTDMLVRGAVELAIVGDVTARGFRFLADAAADVYVPALVIAGGPPADGAPIALLADRPMREGRATAYVCRQYACQEPVTEPEALRRQLADAARA